MNETNLDWALRYRAIPWSVIPIGQDKNDGWKQPLVQWKDFQKRFAPEEEIRGWWTQWPDARVGIITGILSGLVVVDIDPQHGGNAQGLNLPSTLTSRTGGGGWHCFYRHPRNAAIPNATGYPREGIDIRGDGGYVVAPPSIHASGNAYEWVEEFDSALIAPCPDWLLHNPSAVKDNPEKWHGIITGVPEGRRNSSAAVLAGKLIRDFDPHEAWDLLWGWNVTRNIPPLSEDELLKTFTSIQKREYAKPSRRY